ncbi:L,D-transpeptidase [Aestuariibius insulae]|uniref:L,D-transpeptidase n=1 Tax=Aestuariibius insulae TaxID=2058287 RepID=UPI00345EC023
MIERRRLLIGAAISLCAPALLTSGAAAQTGQAVTPKLPRHLRRREVDINPAVPAGLLIVKQSDFHLYWTLGNARAIRYGIALGADGRNFTGDAFIARKAEWPSWKPTANMVQLEPAVYGPYRNGLPGGHPMNPLGSRALYMYQNGRDTFYRVHGTHLPHTIGQGFSSGCVRLRNEDMNHLYDLVPVGTRITVQA